MRVRWLLSVAALIVSAIALAGTALWIRNRAELRPVRLLVATETTRIVSPLKPDGTVDYAAHYAPKHDSLADWLAAGEHAVRTNEPLLGRGETFADRCASWEHAQAATTLIAANGLALASLERAASSGWPETAPWVLEEVESIARGKPAMTRYRSMMKIAPARWALACRCGREASSASLAVSATITEIAHLAESAAQARDPYFVVFASTLAREARRCGELIPPARARELLATTTLPARTRPKDFASWMLEQRRLRLLDATVKSFYVRPSEWRVDINLVLRRINRAFDEALANGGELPATTNASIRDLRVTKWSPFASPQDVRAALSRTVGDLLVTSQVIDLKHLRRQHDARLADEDALERLVHAAQAR